MSTSTVNLLNHILDEINFLLNASNSISWEEFKCDETLQRAFVRSLEIIGEATKKIPLEFREQHQGIEWKKMAAMRDRLIHDYIGVDYQIVWDVVSNRIPELEGRVAGLIESL